MPALSTSRPLAHSHGVVTVGLLMSRIAGTVGELIRDNSPTPILERPSSLATLIMEVTAR